MSGIENSAHPPNPVSSRTKKEELRDFYARALERVLGPTPYGVLQVQLAGPEEVRMADHGASLRLHRERGQVQDFGVFTSQATATGIARNVFSLSCEEQFNDIFLMDVLAEALNQFMGRVKETLQKETGLRCRLDTPSRRAGVSGSIFIRAHEDDLLLRVSSAAWPGELYFVASESKNPVLHGLSEAIAGIELTEEGRGGLPWTQRRLDETCEQVALQDGLASNQRTIKWCASAVGRLANGVDSEEQASALRARIDHELHNLRESLLMLLAPSSETTFYLPEDADSIEVLESFCCEAAEQLVNARDALKRGPERSIHGLLRSIHTIKGSAGFLELIQVQELAHITEETLIHVRDAGLGLREDQRAAVERSLELIAGWMSLLEKSTEDQSPIPFDLSIEDHRRAMEHALETGSEIVSDLAGVHRIGDQAIRRGIKISQQSFGELQCIDQSLAELVNRVAPRFAHSQYNVELGEAMNISEDLSRTVRVMNTVSLRGLFSKIARLARETADRLSKVVRVDASGGSLEVPRHLVSALSGPLVHLARNAADHGLETVEERRGGNKDFVARINLSAYWKEGFLIVEVCDDGRGINPDKLIAKAKQLGLVKPDAELSQAQVLALILEPGFSTAQETTDVSGRGVGLDAVKQSVEKVGGRVEIKSELAVGTTFRIILPTDPSIPVPEDLFCEQRIEVAPPAPSVPEECEELDLAASGEITFL